MLDFESKEEIQEYLLEEGVSEFLHFKSERRGEQLYLPEIDAVLVPVVEEVLERNVGISFYLKLLKTGKQFYEYCAGIGNSRRMAVGMAVGSFLVSFMDGFWNMWKKESPIKIKTEFDGEELDWNVYISTAAGMGDKGECARRNSFAVYWELLGEEIKKRLGNQKLVYVKVYAAKYPEEVIGEVRMDDVPIPELSKMVQDLAAKWEVELFSSEKQFFFLEQEGVSAN